MGFSNIYCDLLKKFSFKYEIKIKMKLTVSNFFPFFVTIHNDFVLVNSNSCISVNLQISTHVQVNLFLSPQND